MTKRTHARAYAARDPRQARGRLLIGVLAGLGTGMALPGHFGWALRAVAGWDVTALVLGALCWWIILHHDAEGTRSRAGSEDPGRNTVWALVLIASAFSVQHRDHRRGAQRRDGPLRLTEERAAV